MQKMNPIWIVWRMPLLRCPQGQSRRLQQQQGSFLIILIHTMIPKRQWCRNRQETGKASSCIAATADHARQTMLKAAWQPAV
jgi:hypothetical protein